MAKAAGVPFETTLRVRDAYLCLHAQRAARALARRFDRAFRPFGLTNGQFSLMMSLNRPEPPAMAAVAQFLAMDRTTLTAALKPLVRRGLVSTAPDPTDKRSRRLTLTPRGRATLAQAASVWEATHAELEASLPQSDPERLRQGLNAVTALSSPDASP